MLVLLILDLLDVAVRKLRLVQKLFECGNAAALGLDILVAFARRGKSLTALMRQQGSLGGGERSFFFLFYIITHLCTTRVLLGFFIFDKLDARKQRRRTAESERGYA